MCQTTQAIVLSLIDVIKAVYKNQAREIALKLENIDYINLDTLTSKVEKEISPDQITQNYDKVVSIIESIIQD